MNITPAYLQQTYPNIIFSIQELTLMRSYFMQKHKGCKVYTYWDELRYWGLKQWASQQNPPLNSIQLCKVVERT